MKSLKITFAAITIGMVTGMTNCVSANNGTIFPEHEPYGRNLGKAEGIELVKVSTVQPEIQFNGGMVSIRNVSDNGTLILAFYNNKILSSVQSFREVSTVSVNPPDDADYVKAFFWDMHTLKPLCGAVRLPVSELTDNNINNKISLNINDKTFTAALEDNSTAAAFKALLPSTLDMSELNGNEKYFYLPQTLPRGEEYTGTINAGDIMLYGDNCIVVFYKTFNSSYTYTKIGHIENVSGLNKALGNGNISIKFF